MNTELLSQLKKHTQAEILTDRFSLGRYASDASIYQVFPQIVVIPTQWQDVPIITELARTHKMPITARGAGTSQAGQTTNHGLVLDFRKHLNRIGELNPQSHTINVQPGVILDTLNHHLKPHGLWFPVDISTASRATIGGMTANNAAGSRSIKYGMMQDNVAAIQALNIHGETLNFSPQSSQSDNHPIFQQLLQLGNDHRQLIIDKTPKLKRNVAGYNLLSLTTQLGDNHHNLAKILIGSEGTLALFKDITLKLQPLPTDKILAIVHFKDFSLAMNMVQYINQLQPSAIELVDHHMIQLARSMPMFRPLLKQFISGDPKVLLIVEFLNEPNLELNLESNLEHSQFNQSNLSQSNQPSQANQHKISQLNDLLAEHNIAWKNQQHWGGIISITDTNLQQQIWNLRSQGLNIMMSMKTQQKPIAFIEDCSVKVEHLADYTEKLTTIFRRHAIEGVFYGHASVGTLHIRPVINLYNEIGIKQMRAVAEETVDLVRQYQGSHSGEHGDGIVRAEFTEQLLGSQMYQQLQQVKQLFDADNLLNPNRLINAPKMDDQTIMRYHSNYQVPPFDSHFDWSDWHGQGSGMQGAIEMCNSNGACLKQRTGVMCPSYRITGDERDSVRGRATTLRLAISGQLSQHQSIDQVLTSPQMQATLKTCVGCKACMSECPMNIDIASMKNEITAKYVNQHGLSWRDWLICWLPTYAPYAAKCAPLLNTFEKLTPISQIFKKWLGFSSDVPFPQWQSQGQSHWRSQPATQQQSQQQPSKQVVLFIDTFSRYFNHSLINSTVKLLQTLNIQVKFCDDWQNINSSSTSSAPSNSAKSSCSSPLCCGRTWLVNGKIDIAKQKIQQTIDYFKKIIDQGNIIVGLEPSCILTFRNEALKLNLDWTEEYANSIMIIDDYLTKHINQHQFTEHLDPQKLAQINDIYLHVHCHQKANQLTNSSVELLKWLTNTNSHLDNHIDIHLIESSCCGMAGYFGYQQENREISQQMAELSLLPQIRTALQDALRDTSQSTPQTATKDSSTNQSSSTTTATTNTLIVASGVSCRQQITLGLKPTHPQYPHPIYHPVEALAYFLK